MSGLPESSVRPAPSGGAVLRVKVVPGASRSEVVGGLGDRVKIALAVPAEKGGANRALELLLAEVLNLTRRSITIASGATSPEKEVLISGMEPDELREKLSSAAGGGKKRKAKK
ncbi:MAG: DUF167 domain-containing protein [Planctomycetaceae bacterium]|nr:DUF167 family protein [Planctomycetota bacterium]NUN53903.1 DUF167 domain-containing protein [Planctomycetaceae bacterium]